MRILIAEDDPASRTLLKVVLGKWGYQVEAVRDGNEAWETFQRLDAPKLAILDWMMPGLDGVDVCRMVRLRETSEPPYLILLTSRGEKGSIVEGLKAGANDYIAKPYDNEELQARLDVGRRMIELQSVLAQRVVELQSALTQVKTLQGLIPICMYCHRIRNDEQSWDRLEKYISQHSEATFSHGICPECFAEERRKLGRGDGNSGKAREGSRSRHTCERNALPHG